MTTTTQNSETISTMVDYPASQTAVEYLLNQPINGTDEPYAEGRSEWRWFVTAEGDTILGFYPQGDAGYTGTEVARSEDFVAAERQSTLQERTIKVRTTASVEVVS